MERCTFTFNQAGLGGAVHADVTDLILRDCDFSDNAAIDVDDEGKGGAIYAYGLNASISQCTFQLNQSDLGGGAIYYTSDADSAMIANCEFTENTAPIGAAAYCDDIGESTFRNCTFTDNQGEFIGAGIYASSAVLTVDTCGFSGNACGAGAAIYAAGSSSDILGSTFIGNTADNGGSMYFDAGTHINIGECTLVGNSATSGGGMHFSGYPYNPPEIWNTIIAFGNAGGAIYSTGSIAIPTLSCCDLYGNVGGDWTDHIAWMLGLGGNISEDPLFCGHVENPDEPYTLDVNSPCALENNIECGQIGAWPVGCGDTNDISQMGPPLDSLYLSPATPNPTAGLMRFTYVIPLAGQDTYSALRIYDASGRLVRNLEDGVPSPGMYEASWDGKDAMGHSVASGNYYYALERGGDRLTGSVTVVR